jgi:hypothetical protein
MTSAPSQAQALPPLMQNAGVPFDMFIQALTEQLDKAQASMAIKARVGKMQMTFAVKEVSLDLRAFVQLVDDEVYVRPSGPGEVGASSIKLGLTTITKPMIEENAMNFVAEDPQFSLREALGSSISDEDRQRLERMGVRSVSQLNDLRQAAGADVVARLARMPVNRLQQAMLAASAPRVSHMEAATQIAGPRMVLQTPLLRPGTQPKVHANGTVVPVVHAQDQTVTIEPLAHQLGEVAHLDFGDGQIAQVCLRGGSLGQWVNSDVEITP